MIVLSGKDDTVNLKRYYEVDTYETRGPAIDQDDLERIATLQELRGVIVFTDPDIMASAFARSSQEIRQACFLNRGEAVNCPRPRGVPGSGAC